MLLHTGLFVSIESMVDSSESSSELKLSESRLKILHHAAHAAAAHRWHACTFVIFRIISKDTFGS